MCSANASPLSLSLSISVSLTHSSLSLFLFLTLSSLGILVDKKFWKPHLVCSETLQPCGIP